MSFDPVVTNPGRLRILTALASTEPREFVILRQLTRLTDGNLCTHARRLESAGMLAISKSFRAGKPVTTLAITKTGTEALMSHVRSVMAAIEPPPAAVHAPIEAVEVESEDEWID